MDDATLTLPPRYAAWVAEILGGPIPEEREATCSRCAMCAPPGKPSGPEFFDPRTKCCTYVPELHNFLVGQILLEPPADAAAAQGQRTVLARIQAGHAVTPMGLLRPRPYLRLYQGSSDAFGHARSMRCPHYVDEAGGLCGVWRNRMSMCATWFCKYNRGAVGEHFWKSLERLLSRVEHALATQCVLTLDPGVDALEALFPVHDGNVVEEPLRAFEIDARADTAWLARVWGRHHGHEQAFYRACAELVRDLSWPEVRAHAGPEVELAERLLREAYDALRADALPERLTLGTFQVIASTADAMRISSYSGFDPLEIPRTLADVLHRFDGRPVDDVLETILTGDRLEIDREIVRKLVDFKILERVK